MKCDLNVTNTSLPKDGNHKKRVSKRKKSSSVNLDKNQKVRREKKNSADTNNKSDVKTNQGLVAKVILSNVEVKNYLESNSQIKCDLEVADTPQQNCKIEKSKIETTKKSEKFSVIEEKDYIEYQLPYGWKKTGHRRKIRGNSNLWDFYVYAPPPYISKFRSNVAIKQFLKENPDVKCDLEVTNTSQLKK